MRDKTRLLLKQYFIAMVLAGIAATGFGCQQNVAVSEADKQKQIATMYREYAQEFPQVKSITVTKLQQLQQQNQKIVLVDVRSPQERSVSKIPGAIAPEEFESNLARYSNSETVVVAYCTIGYRSGKYAQKLRRQGINILNLEGSLLAWSHIQGELVDDKESTKKVHVFSRQWQLTANNYQPVW